MSCVTSPLKARKGGTRPNKYLTHAHWDITRAVAAVDSYFAFIRDRHCIAVRPITQQSRISSAMDWCTCVTYSVLRTIVSYNNTSVALGVVKFHQIVIFISTELLVLRDRKRFQFFNLTFWFYFVIILIINVEMTGVLLGAIFSAKFDFFKKLRSAWLLLKTWRNCLFEMNRTLLSIYTNQLFKNILFPVFTFWRKWKPLKLKDN